MWSSKWISRQPLKCEGQIDPGPTSQRLVGGWKLLWSAVRLALLRLQGRNRYREVEIEVGRREGNEWRK